MAQLPSGTVTFLFTGVEGSTRLWQEHPEAMKAALARHDELLREAVAANDGRVVKTTGDGVHAVFGTAQDAVRTAVFAQRALAEESWDGAVELRVRMGVHSGEAELRDGDYYGSVVNRAARLMGAAHGGQVLVSGVTTELVVDGLAGDVELWSLGEHRLRDLAAPISVFQVTAPGLAREFPPLESLDAFPGNLPVQLSSFVGREREVVAVAGLVRENRLVTLTGVGGVGKTRLALQVAGEVLPSFPDGVWLVELAKVRDRAAVAEAVAAALGVPIRPEVAVSETLTRFLRAKRLLLVLDNCEHLLDTAADLVRTLESACPGLVVLATSREGLGIGGERVVAVPSLGEVDAELLFVGRAEAVKHGFALSDANVGAVREVCRRLDGIPLAIELAAARASVLSPAQIAARLDRRFALLAGGQRGAMERHATLRAAIDWSYDLLDPAEQLMLARLAVFAGGCTLDAAEAVCAGGPIEPAHVIDLLSTLVARSLVTVDIRDAEETWYRLLETIREYAEEHLDPDDHLRTRARHAHHYAAWLPVAVEQLRGPDQLLWLTHAERETENVRAALTSALENHDEATAFALLVAVDEPPVPFVPVGRVVWDATEQVLDLVRATSREHLPRAAALGALVATTRGDFDRARVLYDEARALDDGTDNRVALDLHGTWARLGIMTGEVTKAMEANTSVVALQRRLGRSFDIASGLAGLAAQHATSRDYDNARTEATEALEYARRSGAPSAIAMAQAALAYATVGTDPHAARTQLHALAVDATSTRWFDETTLAMMVTCGGRLGELEATLLAAARILDTTPASKLGLGAVLENTAAVLAPQAPEQTATLHGATDTIVPGYADILSLRGDPNAVATETATPAYQTGRRMTENEAIDFAHNVIRDALASLHTTSVHQ